MTNRWLLPLALLLVGGCKKKDADPGAAPSAPAAKTFKVGVVTDIGGRGDHSFNDSALRGLELWAARQKSAGTGFTPATDEDVRASLPPELTTKPPVALPVTPLLLQSKAQEDYEPNLQTLVDQGAQLVIGVGYMLENAVEAVAKQNPQASFLLIDSPLLDAQGKPYTLPNVRTVVFREEEGSFLVGALAGLTTQAGKVGFVGGMEIPLIKKFEAGFSAGVLATNPKACPRSPGRASCMGTYTGSFNNVASGKQVGQDLIAKGADVLFHAAGTDGLGMIQAAKEARAAGMPVFAIGVDSDQAHLAPDAVLTSMVKRVDLAVYEACSDLTHGTFKGGDTVLGLKEGGVSLAPVRVDFPGKEEALKKVEGLRAKIVAGELHVPADLSQLSTFKAEP
ncbi:MAG: BMP family lipoprotein [Myxococcaceae bacterium]